MPGSEKKPREQEEETVSSPLDKIKAQVREIDAYTLAEYEYDIKINQNENPFDVPADLKEGLLEFARTRSWARYPDFVQHRFAQKLAEHTGWTSEGILVGNGSNELIQATLLVTMGPGAKILLPVPTFTLYKLTSTILGAEVTEVPLRRGDREFQFDTEAICQAVSEQQPDVLIICSPNNPTGNRMPIKDIESLVQLSDGLVLVDEAYFHFSDATCLPLLSQYGNLIITRTFSKAFALAGLRVGYAMGSPELMAEVFKAKLPYNLNFFSQEVAIRLLDQWDVLAERVGTLKAQRKIVHEALNDIEGVTAYRSYANFVLFETPHAPGAVFSKLAERRILVRDVSKYPLLSQALRVTIGTAEENQRFLAALAEVMDELG